MEKFDIVEWAADILDSLVKITKDLYTCNRPPGAAGAAIYTLAGGIFFCGVEPPEGSPTCKEDECEIELLSFTTEDGYINPRPHCVRAIHAEQGAIAYAARMGYKIYGGTMFSILKPCYQCTKLIIAAGIKKIYYAGAAYDEERTRKILENAGVKCIHVDVGLEYGNV